MHNLILVLNCGSSSMKAAVLDGVTGESFLTVLAEKAGQCRCFDHHQVPR